MNQEYVFYKTGGLVMSDGFQIKSNMMSGGKPVAESITSNFAIPASLSLAKKEKRVKSDTPISNQDEVLSDEIYNRLLALVQVSNLKKRGTRREKKVLNKTIKQRPQSI